MYQQPIGRQPARARLQKTRKNVSNIWFFPRALLRHKLRHDESQERTKLLLAQSTVDGRLRVAPPSPQLDIFLWGYSGWLSVVTHSSWLFDLYTNYSVVEDLIHSPTLKMKGSWEASRTHFIDTITTLRILFCVLTKFTKCCVNHLV